MSGTRVVFERPRFSKWGVRVSMSILVGVLLWSFLSSASLQGRVALGGLVVCASPFLLLVWFRVAQRIELAADGVTAAGRLGSRHYTWQQFAAKQARLPSYNWNPDEIATPAELRDVEPLFQLRPPTGNTGTPLQRATFVPVYRTDRYLFALLEGLCLIRGTNPDGDWSRQAATIFEARDALGFGPKKDKAMPSARVIPPG